MNRSRRPPLRPLTVVCLGLLTVPGGRAAAPIRLHPANPHYFAFRGRPTVLITSGEHYGAVLNLDFDFVRYLDTLAADGLNLTRTFTGAYVEPAGAFRIERNTLAPLAGRFICPWGRSAVPGYAKGGNKFDLTRWDEEYFDRLQRFLSSAATRGVVVELALFCPMYGAEQWNLSPMNAANNVNGIGDIARTNVYTLDRHGGLLAVQEAMTRRIVTALKDCDNLIYEICNEPYFGGVTLAWQHHIAETIRARETELGVRHLISRNVANGSAVVTDPHPAISVFNFHYASPPDAVPANYALNRVIGDNETGFRGTKDLPYRLEAWNFILAGGGLFNHLDYSFVAGQEDGTFAYPPTQPGGGNPGFRRQLRTLKDFIESFDFLRLRPDNALVRGGVPAGCTCRVLGAPETAWAIYLSRDASLKPKPDAPETALLAAMLELDLAAGAYSIEWVNPVTGEKQGPEQMLAAGSGLRIQSPAFRDDVALAIRRTGPN
ncbi:MAG: hypothetical protein H7A47_00695 [Verrucomicrobiales bacterium]|nr:hypothetical protein [Verrucomicrobiales bacterium]